MLSKAHADIINNQLHTDMPSTKLSIFCSNCQWLRVLPRKGKGSGLQHQNYLFQIVFELNQPGVRNDRLVVNLTPVAAAGAVAAAKLCLVLLLTPALPYQRRPGPPTSNLSRLRHDSYVESTELPTFARFNSISLA